MSQYYSPHPKIKGGGHYQCPSPPSNSQFHVSHQSPVPSQEMWLCRQENRGHSPMGAVVKSSRFPLSTLMQHSPSSQPNAPKPPLTIMFLSPSRILAGDFIKKTSLNSTLITSLIKTTASLAFKPENCK